MQITVTAKTYDEAITEALLELQTTSDHLDVEVVEEGKDGLLGMIGSKPWVIKAKALTDEEVAEKSKKNEACPQDNAIILEEVAPKIEKTTIEDLGIEVAPINTHNREVRDIKPVTEEEAQELIEKAVTFLKDTFSVMDMDVSVTTSFDHNENELSVVLAGDDMGILIGKRGQTLDSLQYLTSLVVNKHHDGYIRVKLDSENYRERRQEKLEELAKNIAHKVSRTKKAVSLEPMNPYERRIIHSALQDDPYVTTVSEGEEPYRHVIVMMKKGNRRNK